MKFTPMSDEKAKSNDFTPLPAGEYDFEVTDAEETTSKAGNEMLKLTLRVFDNQGKGRKCFDYLVGAMEYKLRHFAETTGLLDEYLAGELTQGLAMGKTGRVKLEIDGDYNKVKDYVGKKAGVVSGNAGNDLDDTIPF